MRQTCLHRHSDDLTTARSIATGPLAVSGRRAFTMLELVIVLAILAVVYAIAAPRFAGAQTNQQVEMIARRLIADLAYAREAARASSTTVIVSFNTTTHEYILNGVTDINNAAGTYTVNVSRAPFDGTIASVNLDDQFDVSDPTNEVEFDGYGQPDSGGTITVQVRDETRVITLDPDTGLASMP